MNIIIGAVDTFYKSYQQQMSRLVKVDKQHTDDVKRLLTLMGVPHVTAPCEAEAQCAELVKKGKCYGVGTEDMDALTFGTNVSN